MSLITKSIDGHEYMLFEGGYTQEQAKKRVQGLRAMELNKHRNQHGSARTVPYEGKYAVFIKIRSTTGDTANFRDLQRKEHSGRCQTCNIRYIWTGKPMVQDAKCPSCGCWLFRTTHLFKGRTLRLTPGETNVTTAN
jgi:Zn finger protein HypA/HybF involved in hydrogenase expression